MAGELIGCMVNSHQNTHTRVSCLRTIYTHTLAHANTQQQHATTTIVVLYVIITFIPMENKWTGKSNK